MSFVPNLNNGDRATTLRLRFLSEISMKSLFFIPLVLSITGCATTKMQTHIDPEHRDRTYSKILVDAPNANFEFKDLMITELCSPTMSP